MASAGLAHSVRKNNETNSDEIMSLQNAWKNRAKEKNITRIITAMLADGYIIQ
jgi:hypothetical protein